MENLSAHNRKCFWNFAANIQNVFEYEWNEFKDLFGITPEKYARDTVTYLNRHVSWTYNITY